MTALATIITTAPRPIPTLQRSVASMREAGFDKTITICNDGAAPVPPMQGIKILDKERMGGLKAWVWSLSYLRDMTHADWLMIAEDDIVWTRNCLPTLLQELNKVDPNAIGYISLYAPRAVTKWIATKNGIHPLPPGYYESKLGWATWGSQCLIVPRVAADRLLNDPAFAEFVEQHVKNKNRDAVVSKFMTDYKLRTMYRIPCFVNHIGMGNSALGNAPKAALETDYFIEAIT